MAKITKKKSDSNILIVKGDRYFSIQAEIVDNMSVEDACAFGYAAHLEIKKQLIIDAYKGEYYVGKVGVVEGLNNLIKRLEIKNKYIRKQFEDLDKLIGIKKNRS